MAQTFRFLMLYSLVACVLGLGICVLDSITYNFCQLLSVGIFHKLVQCMAAKIDRKQGRIQVGA